jgi:hypothetical protein
METIDTYDASIDARFPGGSRGQRKKKRFVFPFFAIFF